MVVAHIKFERKTVLIGSSALNIFLKDEFKKKEFQ